MASRISLMVRLPRSRSFSAARATIQPPVILPFRPVRLPPSYLPFASLFQPRVPTLYGSRTAAADTGGCSPGVSWRCGCQCFAQRNATPFPFTYTPPSATQGLHFTLRATADMKRYAMRYRYRAVPALTILVLIFCGCICELYSSCLPRAEGALPVSVLSYL